MSFGLLVLLVVVGTTIWVGVDASKRDWGDGMGTAGWVIFCILLWIVGFPVYLAKRGKAPLKEALFASPSVGPLAPSPPGSPEAAALYRECPHCKEAVRRDAEVCPHCRKESTPWRFHDDHWWYRETPEEPWEWLDEARSVWVAHEPAAAPGETN